MAARSGAGRPRAEESVRKRHTILDAAQQEFVESGFRGASMRRIAQRSGVSTRTLYNHYADKLALFEACLDKSSQAIQIQLPDSFGTLRERLIAHAVGMQRNLLQESNMRVTRLLYREGPEFEELQRIARIQFDRYQVAPIERILATEVQDPERRYVLASHFVVLALAKWERSMVLNNPLPDEQEIQRHAESVAELFLNGAGLKADRPSD